MVTPLDKILIVEKINKKDDGFVLEKGTIQFFKVIKKGENCRNTYKIGDVVFVVAGQEYHCDDFTILYDDDVLGVV